MGVSKKPSNTRSDMPELGRLNVESYLQAHGIAYNIKADGSKTFYRLNACLFDPNHHKNEAAIVQDSSGLLTYQCFHSSCRAYTWKDAREQISGDESLAKYCNGYDPNWRPPGKKKSKQKRLPPQPHPNRPYEHVTNRGTVRINLGRLAHFITVKHFGGRLVFYQGNFYHYDDSWGFWKLVPDYLIGQIIDTEVNNKVNDPPIEKTLKNLSYKTYLHRPEEQEILVKVVVERRGDLLDGVPEALAQRCRFGDRGHALRMGRLPPAQSREKADPQASARARHEPDLGELSVPVDALGSMIEDSGVPRRAAHDSVVLEPDRHQARALELDQAAARRFEPHQAAARGRDTSGPAAVVGVRDGNHPRRHQRSGASRRTRYSPTEGR